MEVITKAEGKKVVQVIKYEDGTEKKITCRVCNNEQEAAAVANYINIREE